MTNIITDSALNPASNANLTDVWGVDQGFTGAPFTGMARRVSLQQAFNAASGLTLTSGYDSNSTFFVVVSGVATGYSINSFLTHTLQPSNNLSDLANVATARTNLGLGDMALQSHTAVAVSGGTIDGTVIGATTPAAATHTTLTLTASQNQAYFFAAPSGAAGAPSFRALTFTDATNAIGYIPYNPSTSQAQHSVYAAPAGSAGSASFRVLSNADITGLGGAATLNVGTTAGTVAAGNDSRIVGALQATNNLSDLTSAASGRANLGLTNISTAAVGTGLNLSNPPGSTLTIVFGTAGGTVAQGNDSRIVGAAQTSNNLSDLANVSAARTNLGLGGAAVLNVGTTVGTVAAGNDSRIVGALQASNNLSDVGSAPTSRNNLGLGSIATQSAGSVAITGGSIDGTVVGGTTPAAVHATTISLTSSQSASTVLAAPTGSAGTPTFRQLSNSDITGLGGAATLNVGTTAGTVAAGNDSRIVGALQQSNNLSDVSSVSTARTNLGLKDMALQAHNAVAVSGGTIDNTVIGSITPAAISGTTLTLTTSQNQAYFFAAPSGAAGAPSFRALVSADVTNALGYVPQNPNTSESQSFVWAAPSGAAGAPTWRQLNNTDISGLGNSATRNVGTTTGTVADGGLVAAVSGVAVAALPLAGNNDAMTGYYTLVGDAQTSLQPQTKQRVDERNISFASVSSLRAYNPATTYLVSGQAGYLAGYYGVADYGQGWVDWSPNSTQTDDGFSVFRPNSVASGSAGRWLRRVDQVCIFPEQAGAKGDGSTVDLGAFNTIKSWLNANTGGPGNIRLRPAGHYYMGNSQLLDLSFQSWGITIEGPVMPWVSNGNTNNTITTASRLEFGTTNFLKMGKGCGLRNVVLYRNGLEAQPSSLADVRTQVNTWLTDNSGSGVTYNPASNVSTGSFTIPLANTTGIAGSNAGIGSAVSGAGIQVGTVVTSVSGNTSVTLSHPVQAPLTTATNVTFYQRSVPLFAPFGDNVYENVASIGFHTAFCFGSGRFRAEKLWFDSAGIGVEVYQIFDTSFLNQPAANGYWSQNIGGTDAFGPAAYRPGIGLHIHDRADGLEVNEAHIEEYVIGATLNNVWTVSLMRPNLETSANNGSPTYGIYVAGQTYHTNIVDPHLTCAYTCVYFGQTGWISNPASGGVVTMIGGMCEVDGSPNVPVIYCASGSNGALMGTMLSQTTSNNTPVVQIASGAGYWDIIYPRLFLNTPSPWLSIDPSCAGRINVMAGPDLSGNNKSVYILSNMPTASGGLFSGQLWNNGGVLTLHP